jgi:aspartyl protease family protein
LPWLADRLFARWRWLPICLAASLLSFSHTCLALDVQAQALLKNTAVLLINGKQRMIKVGQRSPEGVLLISANPKQAVIEIAGEQQSLTLSQRISSQYAVPDKQQVVIPRDQANQYITQAEISGRRINVLVDTGATSVALSSRQAQQLGIDYKQGVPLQGVTASGTANGFRIQLRSLAVGGIKVDNVQAAVIEGDYPTIVLLGMSYLQHVDMREQKGVLYLQARF